MLYTWTRVVLLYTHCTTVYVIRWEWSKKMILPLLFFKGFADSWDVTFLAPLFQNVSVVYFCRCSANHKHTMFKLTLALALTSAAAMCPNQCSGHGTCSASPKDSCVCFKRRETYDEFGTFSDVDAWTGADCSLREFSLFKLFINSNSAWNSLSINSSSLLTTCKIPFFFFF